MVRKGTLIRSLTPEEFPWLERALPAGKEVYEFIGYTYGCISWGGIAVSDEPDEIPFYEVPFDAVSWES